MFACSSPQQSCQDDCALREVATDLGIEVQLFARKNSSPSLGQPYPVMDDPDFELPPRPVATPMASTSPPALADGSGADAVAPGARVEVDPPKPVDTPTAPTLAALPPAEAAPGPTAVAAADGASTGGAKLAGGGGGQDRRQQTLEELAACHFKPYTNQAVFWNRPPKSLRQATLHFKPVPKEPLMAEAVPGEGEWHSHAELGNPEACLCA